MNPTLFVDDTRALQYLDRIGPGVEATLDAVLRPLAQEIAADARSRAAAHIRYLGARNPGSYVASITGDISRKRPTRVTGYVRSGHPLAHLMEKGFKITDMEIYAKNVDKMAFEGSAGMVYRRHIHRHETQVPAYPAILPAFEARRGEILSTLGRVAHDAGKR